MVNTIKVLLADDHNRADGYIPKSALKRDVLALLEGLLSARLAHHMRHSVEWQ